MIILFTMPIINIFVWCPIYLTQIVASFCFYNILNITRQLDKTLQLNKRWLDCTKFVVYVTKRPWIHKSSQTSKELSEEKELKTKRRFIFSLNAFNSAKAPGNFIHCSEQKGKKQELTTYAKSKNKLSIFLKTHTKSIQQNIGNLYPRRVAVFLIYRHFLFKYLPQFKINNTRLN